MANTEYITRCKQIICNAAKGQPLNAAAQNCNAESSL